MISSRIRLRRAVAAGAAGALCLLGTVVAQPAAEAASTCSVAWSSLAKTSATVTTRQLTNVRSGRHACYDRLVIDLNGTGSAATGYDVRYVSSVSQEGSGLVVPLRGDARIAIVVRAASYDTHGHPTYTPAHPTELTNVSGFTTFRQVAFAGSFEGQTTIGLGVRARLPMKVTRLAGPGSAQRLVVDVAHTW
jgi:hypothetical protein